MCEPFRLVRPLLMALGPETAHGATMMLLQAASPVLRMQTVPAADPVLAATLCGLHLPNPVGLAAGFDKDARVPDAMLSLGFGFVEVGTVTPRPQAGNPRPRLFRLARDRAVINRLGFNNGGLVRMRERLAARAGRPGILGANLGANRNGTDRLADYEEGLRVLYPYADYFTVNVSSPNTPGLRNLQERAALDELLARLQAARAVLAGSAEASKPVFLKVAPDLDDGQVRDIAEVALARMIDGLIVGNTTIDRPEGLQGRHAGEAGGLSGAPLMARSTKVLRRFHDATLGRLPLIGVGGICSGRDAYAKILAGASAVQLYTGLIYGGPGLVRRILMELKGCLRADGFAHVSEAVGAQVNRH